MPSARHDVNVRLIRGERPGTNRRMATRRLILLFLISCGLASGTWLRERPPPRNTEQSLTITPLAQGATIGPFRLVGAWQLESPHTDFGSYSALVMQGPGRLLAISDTGNTLDFTAPDVPGPPAVIDRIIGKAGEHKKFRDVESATRDPVSGLLWLALEGRNAVLRFSASREPLGEIQPVAMESWGENSGPETLLRLADGRFIVLAEGYADGFQGPRHQALLFTGDPVDETAGLPFAVSAPHGYKPTDAVQLPDGRVLVLLRRLLWPFPARFAAKLAIGDPAAIAPGRTWQLREVADLHYPLPVDNFEGLALEPYQGQRQALWLISDGNNAVSQRTILWELHFDPRDLPGAPQPAPAP